MKKFESYIIIGLAALALSSCDRFLSTEPLDMKAYDAIDWTDQGNIDEHLYDILDDWVDLRSYFYMDALTDIAYCNDATLGFRTIGLGYATPVNPGYNFYDYSKIIKCNRFLKEFDANKEVLKEWVLEKYGTAGWNFRSCDIPLQARFVRAWCYLKMLCLYGEVPLILEDTPEGAAVPVASRKEIVDFLVEEADFFLGEAWNRIPNNWRNTTYKDAFPYHRGWVNKFGAAVLGLRIMMYAAAYYDNDTQIWKKIADFAGKVLTEVESSRTEYSLQEYNNSTDLFKDVYVDAHDKYGLSWYQGAFYNNGKYAQAAMGNEVLQEYALTPKECASKINPGAFYPASDGGASACVPTQRLQEAFAMANGLPIYNPLSGFDPMHPFKDRDPRFYETVLFPFSIWRDVWYRPLDRYLPSGEDAFVENPDYCLYSAKSSKTSFGWRKFIDPTVLAKDATISRIPVFRLPEIYLIYAEACAWISGASGTAGGYSTGAAEAVDKLRDRVGCGHVGEDYKADKKKFISCVREERIMEFAGEGLRWFDLARYSLEDETGVPIVASALSEPVCGFRGDLVGNVPKRSRTPWPEHEITGDDWWIQGDVEFVNYGPIPVEEKHFPDPTFFSIPIPQAAYDANPALYDVD